MVKNTEVVKIEKRSNSVEIIMLTHPQSVLAAVLWKTPVEKVVENVEKCEFSTVIFYLLPPVSGVEKYLPKAPRHP